MTTTAERLNNAIILIDLPWGPAKAAPAGTRKSIAQLAEHWVSYWNSSRRRMSQPVLEAAKLDAYAKWYARAWALVPEPARDELTHPRDVDASIWSAVEDQLTYAGEGGQATAVAAKKAAEALAKEVKAGAGQLVKGVAIVGGVAVAVLLALAVAKPRWL